MPVAPYPSNLFKTYKAVYAFLLDCQQRAAVTQQAQLVSIGFSSKDISRTLAACPFWQLLSEFDQPDQTHFYYGHGDRSIAALGTALRSQTEGCSRFARVQQFIDVWRNRAVCYSPQLPESQPHFFCGFTFFDTTPQGSSFAPATVFVPQMQLTRTNSDQVTVSFNCLIDDAVNVAGVVEFISQRLYRLSLLTPRADTAVYPPSQKVIHDLGDFQGSVASALKVMAAAPLQKVVLADALEVLAARPFQVGASLQSLAQRYPGCHVFSFSNGSGQAFVGASPERLLSIRDRQLVTDALAGSAPRGQSAAADRAIAQRLLSNPKECYEHRVVVEFIVRRLRSLGLTPQHPLTPSILPLANIQHLHTPIYAQTGLDPLTLLAQLHPTPAVAGLPRAAACDLIRQSETFARELYAAPLGWVDAAGNSTFVVGIRSALLSGRQARLYAGAGIVPQSSPTKELAEVRLKLQAMLGSLV